MLDHASKVFLLILLVCAVPASAKENSCRMETTQVLHVQLRGRAPMIQGTVNGHPLVADVDTGAFESTLLRSIVERASLNAYRVDPTVLDRRRRRVERATVVGVGGRSEVYRAHVDSLEFGPFVEKGVELDVLWNAKAPVDGIVGVDLLFSGDLEMALASREIRLFHPVNCEDAFLAYWDKEASVVSMDRLRDDRRTIEVTVNGAALQALIDSGAFRSTIDVKAARRAGLPDKPDQSSDRHASAGVGSHTVDFWIVPVHEVVIGREKIHDTRMAVSDLFGAAIADAGPSLYTQSSLERRRAMRTYDMVLGQDFLVAHRVLLSVKQKRFYFSYVGGRVFDVDPSPPGSQR